MRLDSAVYRMDHKDALRDLPRSSSVPGTSLG